MTTSPTCTTDQLDEYTASLLDHREKLQLWAHVAWTVCR